MVPTYLWSACTQNHSCMGSIPPCAKSLVPRLAGLDYILDCWTGLYTGLLDWTTGLDYWTGLLDWTTEVDYWTGVDYMLTYLPTSSSTYCTIIKTMVGNLGWPDCCETFQVNLCMGSTNSLKCHVPYSGGSFSYTVALPLQQWNKVSALKGHSIYCRKLEFFSLV